MAYVVGSLRQKGFPQQSVEVHIKFTLDSFPMALLQWCCGFLCILFPQTWVLSLVIDTFGSGLDDTVNYRNFS